MAIFTAGDKFGVAAANRFVKAEGGGGTAATGEVRLNDVDGSWTWQRYNGASWDDISSLTTGNNDQFLRGDKTWKCPPVNYTGELVIDSNNPATLMIKVPTAVSSVKLKLIGGTFPTWNYTEIGSHSHSGTFGSSTHTHTGPSHTHTGPSHTHTGPSHTHTGPSHRHDFGDDVTSGAASATNHTHAVTGNTDTRTLYTGDVETENHYHAISLTSASGGVAHTHSVSVSGNTGYAGTGATGAGGTGATGADGTGATGAGGTGATGTPSATGTISNTGITGYTLNDTAKVNITDAITIGFSTNNSTWTTKTKADFATIANINNATGTDELNITALVTVNSFNYIKISEPTAKKGGKILYHIEILG